MTLPLVACLATEVFTLPKDFPNWLIQPKFDGHRVLIDYRGEFPRILNRNGRTYSAGPFRLNVPVEMQGYVIDGEYMPEERAYFAFDLLSSPRRDKGELQYDRPLEQRTDMLFEVMDWVQNDAFFVTNRHVLTSDWVNWYRETSMQGGLRYGGDGKRAPIDGILFKKRTSPYTPGRGGNSWLKYKFTSDVDCFVTDLNIDSKANCELSLYDPLSETTFPVGKASTSGKLGVKIDSVVTVRFLKFTKGGRLREPRIVQVRDDKSPKECEISQLIPFMSQAQEGA